MLTAPTFLVVATATVYDYRDAATGSASFTVDAARTLEHANLIARRMAWMADSCGGGDVDYSVMTRDEQGWLRPVRRAPAAWRADFDDMPF